MLIAELVRIADTQVNRHGVPCRVGFTADYIDDAGIKRKSQTVYTENEDIFDAFVVGLRCEL